MAIRPDRQTLEYLEKQGLLANAKTVDTDKLFSHVSHKIAKQRATGRTHHTPGAMNKTEERYARHLDDRMHAGELLGWWFEPIVLRLAKKTSLRIDFMVQTSEGLIEFHEVKGHWEDDARAKVKMAASLYPLFRILAVQRRKGEWVFEEIGF